MSYYVPIFAKIVDSSLWAEPDFVVKVFITMLAKKDKDNVCRGSAFNIARWSNKTEEEVLGALKILSSPDTKRVEEQPFDGRRIERVKDGWLILNGEVYQRMMKEANRKQYLTEKQREHRARVALGVPEASGNWETAATPPPSDKPEVAPPAPAVAAKRFEAPDLETVKLVAAKLGLPEVEAEKFFNHYAANGWRVGKNPMKSWPSALSGWKLRLGEYGGARATNGKPPSIFELKTVLEAKQKSAQDLKNKFAAEGPLTTDWSNPEAKESYRVLRQEIKDLETTLAKRI